MYGDYSRPPLLVRQEYLSRHLAEQGQQLTDGDWNLQTDNLYEEIRRMNLDRFGALFWSSGSISLPNFKLVRLLDKIELVCSAEEGCCARDVVIAGVRMPLPNNYCCDVSDKARHPWVGKELLTVATVLKHVDKRKNYLLLASAVPYHLRAGSEHLGKCQEEPKRCDKCKSADAKTEPPRTQHTCNCSCHTQPASLLVDTGGAGLGMLRMEYHPRWVLIPEYCWKDDATNRFHERCPRIAWKSRHCSVDCPVHVLLHSIVETEPETNSQDREASGNGTEQPPTVDYLVFCVRHDRPLWLRGCLKPCGDGCWMLYCHPNLRADERSLLRRDLIIDIVEECPESTIIVRSNPRRLLSIESWSTCDEGLVIRLHDYSPLAPSSESGKAAKRATVTAQVPNAVDNTSHSPIQVVGRLWDTTLSIKPGSDEVAEQRTGLTLQICPDVNKQLGIWQPLGMAPGDEWTAIIRDGCVHVYTLLADRFSQAVTRLVPENDSAKFEGNFFERCPLDAPCQPCPAPEPRSTTESASHISPTRVTDLPLRHLDVELHSPHVERWIASVNLSEVAPLSCGALGEKISRSLELKQHEQTLVDDDVRELHRAVAKAALHLKVPVS